MPRRYKLAEARNELIARLEGVKATLSDVYHGNVRMLSIDFDPAYETLEDAIRMLRECDSNHPEQEPVAPWVNGCFGHCNPEGWAPCRKQQDGSAT